MSLTKAAEVLNKILYNNEKSNGSSYSQSNSSLPPILTPPEILNENSSGLQNKGTEMVGNLTQHVRIRVDCQKYPGSEIKEKSFENLNNKKILNHCVQTKFAAATGATAVSVGEDLFLPKNATDLNVLAVSRNSSVFPFIEQLFNVERSSMTVGSIADIEFDEFTPLDPSKYKTELCRSYQVHGYCKYGIRCNYAHGLTQIRVAYRHGKYKTRNCQSYHETGFCRYGARCSFIHDAEEGILKCPITDREVLEALHYRPMSEFHHIATITWRMVENDSYPPTEVHFFTPSIGNKITEISDSLLCKSPYLSFDEKSLLKESIFSWNKEANKEMDEETRISKALCNYSSNSSDNSASDNFQNAKVDQKKNSQESPSSETTNENMESSELLENSQSNLSWKKITRETECIFSQMDKASPKKSSPAKKLKSIKNDESSNVRLAKPFLHLSNKRNGDNDKEEWTKNENFLEKYSNYSVSFKNFNLDDFLNCLKTREGQQHLASWASEAERRNSSSTTDSSSSQSSTTDFSIKRQTVRNGRDLSKYKTELCRSYQYNKYCEYNESCLYAHGTSDLRSYPKHPLYRTKKCFSFHKKGFCLYGSRCQFLHDIELPLLQ